MLWFWIACSVKVPDYLVDPYATLLHPQCSARSSSQWDSMRNLRVAQQHARRRLSKVSLRLLNRYRSQRQVLNSNKTLKPLLQITKPSTVMAHFPYNHFDSRRRTGPSFSKGLSSFGLCRCPRLSKRSKPETSRCTQMN